MSSSHEGAFSTDHFVDGEVVNVFGGGHSVLDWHQVHEREITEQLFWFRVRYIVLLVAPTRSFQEHPVNVTSILRLLTNSLRCQFVTHVKIKRYLVYRNCVLSRVVLHYSCVKCLREEKTWNPIQIRSSVINPIIYKIYSIIQLSGP